MNDRYRGKRAANEQIQQCGLCVKFMNISETPDFPTIFTRLSRSFQCFFVLVFWFCERPGCTSDRRPGIGRWGTMTVFSPERQRATVKNWVEMDENWGYHCFKTLGTPWIWFWTLPFFFIDWTVVEYVESGHQPRRICKSDGSGTWDPDMRP